MERGERRLVVSRRDSERPWRFGLTSAFRWHLLAIASRLRHAPNSGNREVPMRSRVRRLSLQEPMPARKVMVR